MKLFTQSFKNLFFAALAMVAGRVVAFPVEITKLTKGSGKDQITIFNIKDAHMAKKNDAINATALIDFAQKKNAMVFVENPKNELKKILNNAQTKRTLNKKEHDIIKSHMEPSDLDTIFLNQFEQSQTNGIETFDPRSALIIPMILLDATYTDNKITEEQRLKALGLYAATLYDLYTTIKQSNNTITDPAIKNYCSLHIEDLKKEKTLSELCLAACEKQIKPENTQELVAIGQKIAKRINILTSERLFDEIINNTITLLDITILQKFDRAIKAGNKNFIFCTGEEHANNLEKFFIDNGYKKLLLHKPDYLNLPVVAILNKEEKNALNNILTYNENYSSTKIEKEIKESVYLKNKTLLSDNDILSSFPEIELSSILKNESSSTPTEDKTAIPAAQNTHLPIFTPKNLLLAGGTLTLIAATKAYGPRLWNWIKSKF